MAPNRRLRWGILSTATIARTKVIPGIARAEHCEVVAIASRDIALAERVAAELSIPAAYGSYEALLADPNIDAVYIPLPNHLHADVGDRRRARRASTSCAKSRWHSPRATRERMIDGAERAGVHADGGVHVPPPSVVGGRRASWWRPGEIGRLTAVQSWFSYYNDDPTNIRNILARPAAARCSTSAATR